MRDFDAKSLLSDGLDVPRGAQLYGRRDANEPTVVAALRAVGATVEYEEGKAWDLTVGYRQRSYQIEVKTEHGRLTKSQRRFQETWRGHYAIVRSAEDALIAIGAVNESGR